LDYTDIHLMKLDSLQSVSESKIKGTVTKVGTDDDDGTKIRKSNVAKLNAV